MATISRENTGKLTDKLTVKVSATDYLPAFEQSLKKYAKSANIPGFRKGFVPVGMIKKMYGKSVFTEEVLKSVEKELNQYMQNEKLDIFGQPLPLESDSREFDMNNPSDYAFAFEIGLKPAIDIDLSKITVTRNKVIITDTMVNEEIERLKLRHGKMTEPEEVTSDDNVLNVTFSEANEKGDVIDGGISKGNSLLVKYFAPHFRTQLIGKKNNDTVVLQLNDAFEPKEREWILSDLGLSKEDPTAGDKYFEMKITKVGLIEKPEMNEEFFKSALPGKEITNESDFINEVKAGIQAQWDIQTKNQLGDQIYHQLIDNTPIEFPEAFLKKWIQQGQETPKTAEEAEKEYPSFESSLKWTLISNQLTQKYNLQVMPDEIKNFAKQQVMSYMGMQSLDDAPWLDSYADSMLKDKKFIENTYYQLQTVKMFDKLEEEVNVIDNQVSAEELQAMQHNHHH